MPAMVSMSDGPPLPPRPIPSGRGGSGGGRPPPNFTSSRHRSFSADDAPAGGGGDGDYESPFIDRRAAMRRQYDHRRKERKMEERRRSSKEGRKRGTEFRRREADRMREFGRDDSSLRLRRWQQRSGRGRDDEAGRQQADTLARAGPGTPLLPPRHDDRRDGYGTGSRSHRGDKFRHDDDSGDEGDDDQGSGWDSDARGGAASGGGSVGGGSIRSRGSRASYVSFASHRALALPSVFQNLSRCVIPSEHEVVSGDDDGVSSASAGRCSVGGGSRSGEDWESMNGSEEEEGKYGADEEEKEREYEMGARREEGEANERAEGRRGPVRPVRSKAHQLTTEEMEAAYSNAVGNIATSANIAAAAGAIRSVEPDDFAVEGRPGKPLGDSVPTQIRTPTRKSGSDPLPLPRIIPRQHRQRHSQQIEGHHHHHKHNHHRHRRFKRSFRRRIFLLLTEPQTSIASAAFFIVLIVAIALSNILMMLQTMDMFQFTPDDCYICGGTNEYYSTNDDTNYFGPTYEDAPIPCECPPIPNPGIVLAEDIIVWFFTVEWILRVVCYAPPPSDTPPSGRAALVEWLSYLTETTTILDALAIFPYYLERYEETNGLLSLRLLRFFRVFQLVRLGQYNVTFLCLVNVLVQAILSLNLLIIVLVFGAAFFGSMIYWLEKGEWKYTELTDPASFAYVRVGVDGVTEEISPFTSIPASFWWFIVTATTVGYGDTYPTSTGGKCVAALAMLMGVLVIAFPVSVFSDLWSKELQKAGVLRETEEGKEDKTESSACNGAKGDKMNGAQFKVPEEVGGAVQQSKVVNGTTESVGANGPLSQEDVNAIVCHLKIIDESQEKIRRILRKCHFEEQSGRCGYEFRNDNFPAPLDKSFT